MKLSIITINYNNAAGLKKTVESIIPYCSKDVEYIVIDGNSTDGSIDIIRKYADRIDYWVSEPDKGIFNAMNKGTEKARGEYLLYINSGDIINNDVPINEITGTLTGEDLIYYDIAVVDENKGSRFIKTCDDYLDFKFFVESTLPHQSTFIKREFILEYGGYDETMKLGGDWALFTDAVCLKKCSYKHISTYFTTYFMDGISSDSGNFKLIWEEKDRHIRTKYEVYNSFYEDWIAKRKELYKLKTSITVRYAKKLGLLKWLKL